VAKLAELAYEDRGAPNAHVHVASCDRVRLRHIADVGHREFGLSIREFPPYDTIDCVHAKGSYHYRTRCSRARRCPWTARGRRNRKNLALDASGPADKLQRFFNWVLGKYGHPSGWFQS
jgi:hypothetical protein